MCLCTCLLRLEEIEWALKTTVCVHRRERRASTQMAIYIYTYIHIPLVIPWNQRQKEHLPAELVSKSVLIWTYLGKTWNSRAQMNGQEISSRWIPFHHNNLPVWPILDLRFLAANNNPLTHLIFSLQSQEYKENCFYCPSWDRALNVERDQWHWRRKRGGCLIRQAEGNRAKLSS